MRSNKLKNHKLSKHVPNRSDSKQLRRLIAALSGRDDVRKIIVTRTNAQRHSFPDGTLRDCGDTENGIKFYGYSPHGITIIFLSCAGESRADVREYLKARGALVGPAPRQRQAEADCAAAPCHVHA